MAISSVPIVSLLSPGFVNISLAHSYPPKKTKYPGISRAIVEPKPLNRPRKPLSAITCWVSRNGPTFSMLAWNHLSVINDDTSDYKKDIKRMLTNSVPEDIAISRAACSLHFISSVGQSVKDEKKAAMQPAVAFEVALKFSTFCKNHKPCWKNC